MGARVLMIPDERPGQKGTHPDHATLWPRRKGESTKVRNGDQDGSIERPCRIDALGDCVGNGPFDSESTESSVVEGWLDVGLRRAAACCHA